MQSLAEIRSRYQEILDELNSPIIHQDPDKLRDLGREQAKLEPIVTLTNKLDEIESDLTQTTQLIQNTTDQELKNLSQEEADSLSAKASLLRSKLEELLNPRSLGDQNDAIVEIRAAAGGDESGLFAGDLYRMYLRFCERKSWHAEELNMNSGGIGNIKEVIFKVEGTGAYGLLKYESGVHRVQRVPKTESSGRIHTSTATVAVLPVIEAREFTINPEDVEMEAFRSSGAGGQNVNKVNSAIRLRHKPSGLVVTAQTERSQLQNRERAMDILRSRLYTIQKEEEQKNLSSTRQSQIGTGDRSEKIRTYNFPQDRITDHRIGQSYHHIEGILDGDLDQLLSDLQTSANQPAP